MNNTDKAAKIIELVVGDMTNRGGFRQAWDEVDPDIQEEILSAWKTLVEGALNDTRPTSG